MKYTKEQRREIYLKAAMRIKSGDSSCICWALNYSTNRSYQKSKRDGISQFFKERFEEFALFEPEEAKEYSHSTYWYDNSEERINALLIMRELCIN